MRYSPARCPNLSPAPAFVMVSGGVGHGHQSQKITRTVLISTVLPLRVIANSENQATNGVRVLTCQHHNRLIELHAQKSPVA